MDEGGVCTSDPGLKPDEKAPGVQEQKLSQLETFLPLHLSILLGRSPLGLRVECGLCHLGTESLQASGRSPLPHCLTLGASRVTSTASVGGGEGPGAHRDRAGGEADHTVAFRLHSLMLQLLCSTAYPLLIGDLIKECCCVLVRCVHLCGFVYMCSVCMCA